MKLLCPRCSGEIPSANVNLAEGVCRCPTCDEWFKVSMLLRDSAPAARTPKPDYTKVEFFSDRDSVGLIIPPGSKKAVGIFLAIFAVFWNGVTWPILLSGGAGGGVFVMLFMIPFVLVGLLILLAVIYMFKGEFAVLLDRSTCRASWSVGKWAYRKSCPTADIDAVVEQVVYTQNYQPVYGVAIKYKGKTLKFGGGLSEAERQWIVGELRHFLKLES